MKINAKMREYAIKNLGAPEGCGDAVISEFLLKAVDKGTLHSIELAKMESGDAAKESAKSLVREVVDEMNAGGTGAPNSRQILLMGLKAEGSGDIRVKGIDEAYSTEKPKAKHFKTGAPIVFEGKELELSSQLETAKLGTFIKWQASMSGVQVKWTEHDEQLWRETVNKDCWHGDFDGQQGAYIPTSILKQILPQMHQKALLDSNTSGGSYATPTWYDMMLVTYPLLHSQILPYVTVREVNMGSDIAATTLNTPTVVWGVAEGTPADLFNTASLIGQITETEHPVSCYVEIGNDFLSDTPYAIGQELEIQIGERMKAELDRVIVLGNGTSEPQGIMNASGTIDVTSEVPTTGPMSSNDASNLYFAVGKQYREGNGRTAYISTDTTYKRARQIATGVTGDDRLLFGMDIGSYKIFDQWKILNEMANDVAIFGDLSRYRLWRRKGYSSKMYSEGQTLALKNTSILAVRGRYAGKVVDGSAFAIMTSLPV